MNALSWVITVRHRMKLNQVVSQVNHLDIYNRAFFQRNRNSDGNACVPGLVIM